LRYCLNDSEIGKKTNWLYHVHDVFQEEQKELDEIIAKRKKRGKQVEDKPVEEKSTLHSK